MRWLLVVLPIVLFISCSSPVLKYSYLPKSNFKFYTPHTSHDLGKNKYNISVDDGRNSDLISCSEITLPGDSESEGDAGLSYFKNYIAAMIEANNGVIDRDNGQSIQIELKGLSSEKYGFVIERYFGMVEFVATFNGKTKKYCAEMAAEDEDSPIGAFVLSGQYARRDVLSGAVRRALEEFIGDLSVEN